MPEKGEMVKIVNGDQEGYCMPQSVGAWERNGWTVVEDGNESAQPQEVASARPQRKPEAVPAQEKE